MSCKGSEFFKLTHEEAALARFALEAQLVAMVFEGADVAPLKGAVAQPGPGQHGAGRPACRAQRLR